MVKNTTKIENKKYIFVSAATRSTNSLREVFVARYPNGKVSPRIRE